MKKMLILFGVLTAVVLLAAPDNTLSKDLTWMLNPKRWGTCSSMVTTETPGAVTLTFNVVYQKDGKTPKDRWPRCYLVTRPEEGADWRKYDMFECMIYTDFSRPDETWLPVSFYVDAAPVKSALERDLKFLKQGQWVKFQLPLAGMKGSAPVSYIQFHLDAVLYQPNDRLTLKLRDMRLIRTSEWKVSDFRTSAVKFFAGRKEIPVSYTLVGPDAENKIPFSITNTSGEKVSEGAFSGRRGPNSGMLNVSKLTPGSYTVTIFPGKKEGNASFQLEAAASPF